MVNSKQGMIDIESSDEVCSNCQRWDAEHKFDLKGFCKEYLIPMRFFDNCKSIGLKNKFKKRKY